MTEEQIAEIIKALEDFKKADVVSTVICGIMIIFTIALLIYSIIKYQQAKKILQEYYSTLSDEEKRKLKIYREVNKRL